MHCSFILHFIFIFLFLSCNPDSLFFSSHRPATDSASHHLTCYRLYIATEPPTVLDSIHLFKSVNNHPFSLPPMQIRSGRPPSTVYGSLCAHSSLQISLLSADLSSEFLSPCDLICKTWRECSGEGGGESEKAVWWWNGVTTWWRNGTWKRSERERNWIENHDNTPQFMLKNQLCPCILMEIPSLPLVSYLCHK